MDAVFSFVKPSENSMVASVRIARFVSDTLGLPILWDGNIRHHDPSSTSVLILVNGAFAFCKCLEELAEFIRAADVIVWAQNDYTIIPPKADSGAESPFRMAFRERRAAGKPHIDYWTTVSENSKATSRSTYVNWNCLTFDLTAKSEDIEQRRAKSAETLLYYGSFRSDRKREFDRYFQNPRVDTVISSPAWKKFQERYSSDKIMFCDRIPDEDFYERLGTSGLGLFLEDRKSHSEFHSPPNRFYEMLSAGLPIVFQQEAGLTMRKAGYDPKGFYVGNPLEVMNRMAVRENIGMEQRLAWYDKARDERVHLAAAVRHAWGRIGE